MVSQGQVRVRVRVSVTRMAISLSLCSRQPFRSFNWATISLLSAVEAPPPIDPGLRGTPVAALTLLARASKTWFLKIAKQS